MGNKMDANDPRLRRVDVIGVPISATNMGECLGLVTDELDSIRGEYICVANVHTTVMAHDDPEYMTVQSSSILSIPDGMPLSVVGRKQEAGMGRVTGPDLMRELFAHPAAARRRHYFYGNSRENLQVLVDYLGETYPELAIAGYEPSVFRDLTGEEEQELADRINAASADYIWVAIGAPRQENLCYRLKGRVGGLMVGVGGAFNVIAGITSEAPRWMQGMSLEWLYRLIQEPRRLIGRYVTTNTKFIFYLITKKRPRSSAAGRR